jgi:aspartate/methionine/tyrosine aminotransferase
LTDEVYRELCFAEAMPSIAAFHPNTLVAGSLSKSNSLTGLRLGWLAGPVKAIAAATKVHQFVNTAASTFSQRVAIELFRDRRSISAFPPHYRESLGVLLGAAAAGGIDLLPPEGAFYGFIRLSREGRVDSLAFAEKLLDQRRVVTVPGRAFGDSGEGWLRVSWVAPPELLVEGMKRIGEAIHQTASGSPSG